jgi:NAD(P)H-hydrate epimerase
MKILSAKQTKEADQYTLQNEPISSLALMERASERLFKAIVTKFPFVHTFSIFCGPGNNGGDGLVLARLLTLAKKEVFIHILKGNYTPEFLHNFHLIKELEIPYLEITDEITLAKVLSIPNSILIDALFGIGLSRPLEGLAALLIQKINAFPDLKIAIDVPSGLSPDATHVSTPENSLQANHTLSIQLPKLSFFFAENQAFIGNFECIDIQLSQAFIQNVSANLFYIQADEIRKIRQKRPKFGHKGTFGHTLVIAGSEGKIGAAMLSAKAALKTGCGLVTVYLPEKGVIPMHTYFPEAMVISRENPIETIDFSIYDAIAFGPGMGNSAESKAILVKLLENYQGKIVIDADGLNILAANRTLYKLLSPNCILTPHPKEFDRLTHSHTSTYERNKMQIAFSQTHKVTLVLKGHNSSTSSLSGNCYFNSTGNNGMATAGSGDVLTGIIVSLCAQGYSPDNAAIMGVYLHGFAGDAAAEKYSQPSLIASDIIEGISAFYKET